MSNGKKRKPTNRRKKKFLKAKMGEKSLREKMLDHVRSPGYVEHVPDWPDCVFENR